MLYCGRRGATAGQARGRSEVGGRRPPNRSDQARAREACRPNRNPRRQRHDRSAPPSVVRWGTRQVWIGRPTSCFTTSAAAPTESDPDAAGVTLRAGGGAPGVWWRKSAFDLARARRANRLRLWRWLTEPVATFRIWLATGRRSPAKRAWWNRRAAAAAAAEPLLSALDPHQRRAAACFEDRAMVTAGAATPASTARSAGGISRRHSLIQAPAGSAPAAPGSLCITANYGRSRLRRAAAVRARRGPPGGERPPVVPEPDESERRQPGSAGSTNPPSPPPTNSSPSTGARWRPGAVAVLGFQSEALSPIIGLLLTAGAGLRRPVRSSSSQPSSLPGVSGSWPPS